MAVGALGTIEDWRGLVLAAFVVGAPTNPRIIPSPSIAGLAALFGRLFDRGSRANDPNT